MKLSEEEKCAIDKLTDMSITCSLNPETVQEDKEIGKQIITLIKQVNCHRCTNPCKRYGDKCKYGFPKFPLKETLVVDKHEFSDELEIFEEDMDINTNTNYRKILSDVEDVLKDDDKIEEIMSKWKKGKKDEEYAWNRDN